jgi:hypothetical protein
MAVLFAVSTFGACTVLGDPSERVVTGLWGAPGAEINATGTTVRLLTGCTGFVFLAPIIPSPDGTFFVAATAKRLGWGTPIQATMSGRVTGATMRVRLTTVTADTAGSGTFTVTHGVAGQFGGIYCSS